MASYTYTSATLTLAGWAAGTGTGKDGNWYYKRTLPDGGACSAAQTGQSVTPSIAINTDYTFKAYSDSGCSTAKVLATASFYTGVTVGNLGEAERGGNYLGQHWETNHARATGFTTGANSSGYTLQSVTIRIHSKYSSPTGFTAAIHAATGGNPAATATYTLSGAAPTGRGDFTYTCSGSCTLSASTDYFLVLSATGPSRDFNYYYMNYTDSSDETNAPAGAGWTIADQGKGRTNNGNWGNDTHLGTPVVLYLEVKAAVRASLSVSNLGQTADGSYTIGRHTSNTYVEKWATSFATGSSAANGYTLQSLTARFGAKNGSPGNIAAKIHADSSGVPGTEVASLALSGPVSPSSTDAVYTCAGTGCSLSASTTYHLVFEVAGSPAAGVNYQWTAASADGETNVPSGAGWSIGNSSGQWRSSTSSWTANANIYSGMFSLTVAANPALAASDVTATTATLTLTDHNDAWWYKRTVPSGDDSCTSVAGTTVSLDGLTANTSHTYKAYDTTGCNSTDEIASATFTTLAAGNTSAVTPTVAGWRLERDAAGVLRVTAGPALRARSDAATGATPAPVPGSRDAGNDVTALAAAGNTSPDGLWSDGATLWVVDTDDRMLYAYDLAAKTRDPGNDVILSRNARPLGLASDGVTLWVSDDQAGTVYAYPVPGAPFAPGPDVALHPDNASPSALYTDGATLWVAEDTDGRLYAYRLPDGARDPARDLTLHEDNASSGGLWSDGVTMWVSDPEAGMVYAYRLSDGARDASRDYDLGGAAVYGLWSDGWTLWVVDDGGEGVVAYRGW